MPSPLVATDELPTELTVITLNCWGLKYISALRRERLAEIGSRLAALEPAPHIVGLQECWTQEDYRAIRRATRFVLPYGKFYHSGAFGGGLAILSRWPIEESSMFPYPLNGRPTAFWRGDWYVGKGIAHAKIRYGPGPKHVIEVFNTHTHAPYEHGPKDSYLCHRLAQAWEASKHLRGAAERGHLVLGLGDFNMKPLSLPHQLITAHAPAVRDTWRVLHPDSSLGASYDDAERARRRPIPTADFNIRENGVTSDSVYCTWRWTKAQRRLLGPGKPPCTVPPDAIDRRGHRLDYVFASAGDVAALGGGWVVRDARVGMMERHPELGCSLSDHFSAEVTLAFQPSPPLTATAGADTGIDAAAQKSHEQQAEAVVTRTISHNNGVVEVLPPAASKAAEAGRPSTMKAATPPPAEQPAATTSTDTNNTTSPSLAAQLHALTHPPTPTLLPSAAYDEVLSAIHRYSARERAQRRWRAAHFFASIAGAVGCLAGVWLVGRRWPFAAFILALVSTLAFAAGAVDGLMALLFFGSEIRALKEFEWEILNAKAAAAGGRAGRARGREEDEGEAEGDKRESWS